jgi:chorismate dehydratase
LIAAGVAGLEGVRVGCVAYLNSRPLIEGFDRAGIFLGHPIELASRLESGLLDVALVPSAFALAHGGWGGVDGVAIAARGKVRSVFVAWRGGDEPPSRVALDPASVTSVRLARALWRGVYGKELEAAPLEGVAADGARLLIGDRALAFAAELGEGWRLLDLGEAWREWTGLPFVFAAWMFGPGFGGERGRVAEALRAAKARGVAAIPEIARATPDPAAARSYLEEAICFDLGPEEKAGLARFGAALAADGCRVEPVAWH